MIAKSEFALSEISEMKKVRGPRKLFIFPGPTSYRVDVVFENVHNSDETILFQISDPTPQGLAEKQTLLAKFDLDTLELFKLVPGKSEIVAEALIKDRQSIRRALAQKNVHLPF